MKRLRRGGDGTWEAFFEHLDPAPPGLHFLVLVKPDGTTWYLPGE